MDSTQNPTPYDENNAALDDVEAHGLKEVAAGIGAAALLTGAGAGAALAAQQQTANTSGHKATHAVQSVEDRAAEPLTRHMVHSPPPEATTNVIRTPANPAAVNHVRTKIAGHLPGTIDAPTTNPVHANVERVEHAEQNATDAAAHLRSQTVDRLKHTPPTL
jgi:hypothetical protein